MKKLAAIIKKDVQLRFAAPAEWLFFLILPIIFTVILAGGTGDSADARVRLVVVDQAATPLSGELIAALEQSATVRPDRLSLDEAQAQFSQRRVSALLVIPAGFDRAQLEQGNATLELRQQPNNVNAIVAYQAVRTVINRLSSAVDIARSSVAAAEDVRPFASAAAQQAYFDTALRAAQVGLAAAPERVTMARGATPEEDTIEYDPRANSSAGQLITWVFVPLLGISGLFAYERQKGTLRRLLTTPTQKATYLLGTIAGQVLLALVQMLLLVGFAILVLHLRWGDSPAALAAILVTTALAGAALGTTLGALTRSEGQANGLSWMLGMVLALLGGCWYPGELFPAFVRNATKVLPTTWAMQGMLDIVLRGQGFAGVLPEAAVLLGFAVICFAFGVWRFRYE